MNSVTSGQEPAFWMNGLWASELIEVSSDPSSLADGDFWAISTTYEGEFRAAKFAHQERRSFPTSLAHQGVNGKWISNTSQLEYEEYVALIRSEIEMGNVYQVNACRRISVESDISLRPVFEGILAKNPAPYASYLNFDQLEIASASPELFLMRDGDKIKTSPIKGTKPSAKVSFGNKDRAENVMIVDLMRNDLGQICKPGSIAVPDLLRDEEHPGLHHLVSDVTGELQEEISWAEIFSALLPAGSISGAPKSAARKIISENEKSVRGPYCGVIGWVHGDQALLSVAIRIFWREENKINFGTGAGITWGSVPADEWKETELKAAKLISIVGGAL